MHDRQVHITQHAYERYCERVERVSYDELVIKVEELSAYGIHHKRGYVRTGDIWWRGSVSRDQIVLHTCYGVTHIDVPQAIKWAKRFKDRLALEGDPYGD